MGNCVLKGFGVVEVEEMVKVAITDGGIMELYAPITAECITNEFPGHGIYRNCDHSSQPLLHNEELHGGELYYLLPLNTDKEKAITSAVTVAKPDSNWVGDKLNSSSRLAPYRMSIDNQRMPKRRPLTESVVFPRYNNTGVWKVKLVISPDQLADILTEEARTEELIESVRTVAKFGNGFSSSSVAGSDQGSMSTTWKEFV